MVASDTRRNTIVRASKRGISLVASGTRRKTVVRAKKRELHLDPAPECSWVVTQVTAMLIFQSPADVSKVEVEAYCCCTLPSWTAAQ
eukprot:NODE_1283_length_1024_cov_60.452308_g984_i0.p2 GENE.NODE_1283_length_1024_cov_60.452308_g984_i0~~NODE_1283_length_1024_cov_60.452308_g984_i0.p2  ORF type:complete len:87 (+),score=1.12 NODE_1283_length_1024_cov_60.452308_g984_i0:315-575(+)